jgi:hypothetical protein
MSIRYLKLRIGFEFNLAKGWAAFGNLLSSLRDRARSGLAASRFNQAQGAHHV